MSNDFPKPHKHLLSVSFCHTFTKAWTLPQPIFCMPQFIWLMDIHVVLDISSMSWRVGVEIFYWKWSRRKCKWFYFNLFYVTFIDVTPCPPLLHNTYREGISEEDKTIWFLRFLNLQTHIQYPHPQNPVRYSEVKFKQKLFLGNPSHSQTCQNQFQFHHLFPFYARDATRPPPSLPPLYQSLYKLQFISDGFGCNTDPCKTNFTDLFIAQHTMWGSASPLNRNKLLSIMEKVFSTLH